MTTAEKNANPKRRRKKRDMNKKNNYMRNKFTLSFCQLSNEI